MPAVNDMEDLFIYIPQADEIVSISEGSGENLSAEDIRNGYDGCLEYNRYEVNLSADRATGLDRIVYLTKVIKAYNFSAEELDQEPYYYDKVLWPMDGGILLTGGDAGASETDEGAIKAVLSLVYGQEEISSYWLITPEFADNLLGNSKVVAYAKSAGGVRKAVEYFATAAEAEAFCDAHKWRWLDGNGFEWSMSYEGLGDA